VNKTLMKIVLLLGYSVPFVFLAMYGDVAHGTMLLYGFMIIGYTTLCFFAIKSKQIGTMVIGNTLSWISSYICMQLAYTERWSWYFKPFRAETLMLILTVMACSIQILFALIKYKKTKDKKKEIE